MAIASMNHIAEVIAKLGAERRGNKLYMVGHRRIEAASAEDAQEIFSQDHPDMPLPAAQEI